MKTVKRIFLLMFVTASFMACSNDDDNDPEEGEMGGGGTELFTATIDGASFAADTSLASLIGGSFTTTNGVSVLVGQGSTNNGDFINFAISDYTGLATYTTGDDIMNTNLIQYGEVSGQSASIWASNLATSAVGGLQPGEIVVTVKDDTHAEGTFSFEGYNATDMTTKTITSGKFNIQFDN